MIPLPANAVFILLRLIGLTINLYHKVSAFPNNDKIQSEHFVSYITLFNVVCFAIMLHNMPVLGKSLSFCYSKSGLIFSLFVSALA